MRGTYQFSRTLAFVVALALVVTGCGHSVTVTQYKMGGAATFTEAPEDGMYCLFSGSGAQKAQYELSKGDNVGFRSGENGKIIAVAGPEEIELADGNYYWQLKKK